MFGSGERDQDVKIWGISSGVTFEFEAGFEGFFFVGSSINGAPTALIWGSFLVKNSESVSDRGWSFKDEIVFLFVGKSHCKALKLKSMGIRSETLSPSSSGLPM